MFAARGGAGEDGDDAAEGEGEHETEGLYAAAILGEAGKERGLFDDDGDDAKPVAASLGAGADSARELECVPHPQAPARTALSLCAPFRCVAAEWAATT